MSNKSVIALLIAGGLAASTSAFADHNSIWGAGSANMPNDIHNTRIEDDDETFLELVQQGGGADSVNRYADDDDMTLTDSQSRMTSLNGGSRMSSASRMASRSSTMSRGGRH